MKSEYLVLTCGDCGHETKTPILGNPNIPPVCPNCHRPIFSLTKWPYIYDLARQYAEMNKNLRKHAEDYGGGSPSVSMITE